MPGASFDGNYRSSYIIPITKDPLKKKREDKQQQQQQKNKPITAFADLIFLMGFSPSLYLSIFPI